MEASPQEVTALLRAWRAGDDAALAKLLPLVYAELRRAARAQMARHPGHSLQPTALINEVYLRLAGAEAGEWRDRAHFIGFCATMMRNILVDHFRRRRRQVELSELEQVPVAQDVDVIKLDEALASLAKMDERGARAVELKFFGGLTFEEAAEVLGVSVITVKRDWQKARAWLYHELGGRP